MRPASLMKMSFRARLATSAAFATLFALLACTDRESSAYARSAEAPRGVTIVDPVTTPYTPMPVSPGGSISGSVRFAGEAPADSAVIVTRDDRVCGNTLRQITVETNGDRVVGALVWLADIRRGRPLPVSRRAELVQTRCTFGPVAQVAIAGGALNVRTQDALLSRTVVVDARTLDTLAVLPFNSAGSLIPLDAPLRRPALLEIRSTTHPWMEAWVAVLDHPYFTTTDREGAFRLEDVPPGQYSVKTWHPRFGLASGIVTVQPGSDARLELGFGAQSERTSSLSAAMAVNSNARYSSE